LTLLEKINKNLHFTVFINQINLKKNKIFFNKTFKMKMKINHLLFLKIQAQILYNSLLFNRMMKFLLHLIQIIKFNNIYKNNIKIEKIKFCKGEED
jgi:hypothetical protein